MEQHINKQPIIKPPRLSKGDQIGIISPAGPVSEPDLLPGLEILKSAGFRVLLAPHVYDKKDYLAGEDNDRLKDLHAMLQDPETKAVLCARGGYGSLRLLEKVRYDLIKKTPKIIAGYSDITALLMAVHKKTGLITFHGPMVRGLANDENRNWKSLLHLVSSQDPLTITLNECHVLVPGKGSGVLIGGNLTLICHLLGTPFLPSFDKCILFIEDRGEPLYRLDRMLTHLALTGKLKGLAGLIAGQFEECGDNADVNSLLTKLATELGIPLVSGFPIGHGEKNLSLPLGMRALLNTETMTLTTEEACVK